ncbi:MAG TPA: TonB-dependent receptor [Chitinophagaceae bacterium]|nr:TonB-dependent receptor [Chitinophagaceae bacterium]
MSRFLSSMLAFLVFVTGAFGQTTEVTGKVTDQSGLPLAGVTVSVKGSTLSTFTNADGSFRLTVQDKFKFLVFSFVGFQELEQPISATMSVSLTRSDNILSEVVVVGYGTKLKKDVTTSVSKIGSKEFQNLPLPSFETALQGRASGVFINQGSGKLGQALNIRVRGLSSISANQQPFIVIDGVPVTSKALGSATEPDNPLATINPDDIESIEILKDAASAAIYGSRASNGVILITTKSGKVGKTKVSLGYFTGFSRPTKKQKFLNAAQYRELFTVAAEKSDFGVLDPADEFMAETGTDDWNGNNDVNWAEEAFQHGSVSQYSVSVTGGDPKTRFLVSGSFNDQKGILLGNRLDRANGRVNLDHSVNSRIKVGLNLSLVKSRNYRVPGDNAFSNPLQLNALPPLHPKYDPTTGKLNTATLYYNNLIDQVASTNLSTTFRSINSAFAEISILPELLFRSQIGVDFNNLQEETYNGRETLDGAPTGVGFNNQVTSSVVTATNTLNYKKKFKEDHDFDALAGIEYQVGKITGASVTGQAFPNDRFTKIASAAIISAGSSSETEYTFASYFLKANYKFKDKYLFGGSFRVDGSSRFAKDNRYGVFPAVSAGWILSEENFLKSSRVISFLKLRSSYGRTGNAEIGDFSSLSLYSASAYADIAGIVATQLGVPNLSWERTDQYDIGIDFGLFSNRLTGEVDYFNKTTKDLLLNVPLPNVNGFTSITKNIGSLENKGWEFVVNGNILTGKFTWRASVNISTYRNKVTKLVVPVPPGTRTLGRLKEGEPFGQFFGKWYAGVDPANGDALYYLADGKTTNSYSAGVDTIIGDPNPDYYGGINNKISYKGFDLDIQCQFVKGGDAYNMAGFFQSVNGDYFDNQTVDQLNYWKNPGDVTNIPQPRLYSGNGAGKSSRWVQDASYFRIKSINLGYNFPRKIATKLKLDNIRIYAAASNVATITKYKGYDPEVNSGFTGALNLGHDFYTPPQARTITFGINVGF